MTQIDPRIFRAYDIRGRAGDQLTEDASRAIGQAFGTVLRRKYKTEHPTVVVGRDARTHGPGLERALIDGLKTAGCRVFTIGACPSPVNYFTICAKHLDGGVQVTASHNPAHDNGLKLQTRDAEAHAGDDLQKVKTMIENGDLETGEGSEEPLDGITPYVERLTSLFGDVARGKRIAVDAGNGIAGPVNCRVLKAVGAEVHELYTEPDGRFPNHPADPSKHDTLKELQALVQAEKLDVGFGFDGDGDRLGLVDDQGKVRTADETLLLLAKDHLSHHSGSPIVFTVSNSSLLQTEVERWGGKPVMTKVGHSFVEHAMREHDALLGGEQSGHFFCGDDYYPYDDALVACLRVLLIMQEAGDRPLSEQFASFPKVYQAHEMRPFCPDDKKTDVVHSVTAFFAKTHPVNAMDGARIDFGDGAWAGIRQSNTSPCLSICIEARSAEKLAAVEREVMAHMRTYADVKFDEKH